MAHEWYRSNLANAVFPFYTDAAGRTIIMAGQDQNYNYLDQIGEPTKDRGVPKAFYMHNCMPTEQGYQAIGYDIAVPAMPAGVTDFDDCFVLEDTASGSRVLFSPANGKNYIFDASVGPNWLSVDPLAAGTAGDDTLVTTAFVNGETYIFYAGIGCLRYNPASKALDTITLTALTEADVLGICAAVGYMIAWTAVTVVWSSTIDPTDFTPSIITGAGGGSLQYANGEINFCLPINNGFIAYCERNSVGATYSNNINFPWIFGAIPKAGGVNNLDRVGFTSLTGGASHHIWSTLGMQEVSRTSADLEYPEASDFLALKIFEDFNEQTLELTQTYLGSPLNIKVAYIAERFVCISYGVQAPEYTHCLIFDNFLKRWGKLKITHRKCFEWPAPNIYGPITYGMLGNLGFTYGQLAGTTYGQLNTSINVAEYPLKAIAFLQGNGQVQVANFDVAQIESDGVLFLGKFQFIRNKFITHQRSDVENVLAGNNFQLYITQTLDGKTIQFPLQLISAAPNLYRKSATSMRCQKQMQGQNIIVVFVGAFNLNSYLMDFTVGGER